MMHAVMMTSTPPIIYWNPITLEVIRSVLAWRKTGIAVAYTIDAGANVHVICESAAEETITTKLSKIPGIKELITAHSGGSARLI